MRATIQFVSRMHPLKALDCLRLPQPFILQTGLARHAVAASAKLYLVLVMPDDVRYGLRHAMLEREANEKEIQ